MVAGGEWLDAYGGDFGEAGLESAERVKHGSKGWMGTCRCNFRTRISPVDVVSVEVADWDGGKWYVAAVDDDAC